MYHMVPHDWYTLSMSSSPSRIERITHIVHQRQDGVVAVFENIADPHNASAAMRSAEAFGIQRIVFVFSAQPPFDVMRIGKSSSASAKKWLTIQTYSSIQSCVHELKEASYTCIGTSCREDARSLLDERLHHPRIGLFFGNEHAGLTDEALALMNYSVTIPLRGFVQSLNLSVTAGILFFELTRQRIQSGNLRGLSPGDAARLQEDLLSR